MKFLDFLKRNVVVLDGGMGTLLQKRGLKANETPESWNLTRPEVITEIHKQYYDAGSNVVATNTFGASILKHSREQLEKIVCAAIKNARRAAELSSSDGEKFVALDIGPTGRLLAPLGDLDFEDAVSAFGETVKLGVKYGADLIIIETMNDSYETKAALLAAKENSTLPVIVTNAYGADGKLMTGADATAMSVLLEGLGADAIGANCSLGPKQLRGVIERLLEVSSVPVVLKPNAGLPRVENGKTVFDVTIDEFAREVCELVRLGVRAVGGCCGTTPEYIKALSDGVRDILPIPVTDKNITAVSSYTHAVIFGKSPVLIGERINPTGKKRFKQALIEGDVDYILAEGVKQEECGVAILDVNVGIPEVCEREMLTRAVSELQSVVSLPLQIDTSDTAAMESALRCYNGKAMLNSVNGKEESMRAVFPLVKKYGGLIVALTLDEGGIPESADGRVAIAAKILKVAEEYGISKKNLIFDPLAMTVSADGSAAAVTLEAVRRINLELGCHTSLGVSNVSFGLPCRDAINSIFFTMALENGLSAAIMNPYSADMMRAYYSYRALRTMDENCADYISAVPALVTEAQSPTPVVKDVKTTQFNTQLSEAIIKGFKERAGVLAKELLRDTPPMQLVQNEIIPALNTVGRGFEEKTVYLPQLLMSAEAAKAAFDSVKAVMSRENSKADKGVVVIATVKGDVHDIGKNILRLLLENYGFGVIDLGKDVSPETIVEATLESKAALVGLSALMTTTVPAMEETIKMLRSAAPCVKIVVGGAVLTKEYAEKIGADKYAADAMEGVRYAEEVYRA